jgi:glutathione S-transferase
MSEAHLEQPDFRRWRAMGLAEGPELKQYDMPLHARPSPPPDAFRPPVETGTPENAACPYSGKPVTHLAEIGGRVFGFCNAFCRDKTVRRPRGLARVHGNLRFVNASRVAVNHV